MKTLILLILLTWSSVIFAENRTVNLDVGYKTVNFTGKSVQAIAVNNQIPGPTLHFKDGDHVVINVFNHLDTGTTMHWHGLLVPWRMDGVEGITQAAIPPGGVFHYEFTLHQSGTYWYHSHAGFQEQQGDYGAIIIDPKTPHQYHYNKDYVVVLSDWINTSPEQVYANLKKDGDYYSTEFSKQASLQNLIQNYSPKLLDQYLMMEHMRMSIYDYTDVKDDAYLLNGQTINHPWVGSAKVGDTVRLRFIGAASSTIFKVSIPGTAIKIISVDGQDVRPYVVDNFTIAPGETYDALIKITKIPLLIHTELSKPEMNMGNMAMGNMSGMNMSNMNMSGMDMGNMAMGDKYQNLVSSIKTNNPNKPIYKIIHMDLGGYMGRYIWFINGIPESDAHPILFVHGKRYRIIFTNSTMMHHPMHIHGHFFILRNGHGAYDPLLHTIDVGPGEKITADIDANASGGQWFFHCHLLYHMMAGMSRVFQYTSMKNRPMHPMAHPHHLHQATFLDVGDDPFDNLQKLTLKSYWGGDFNKLEIYSEDAELEKGVVKNADVDIFAWHLISEFWAVKGGMNYFYRPAQHGYWQPGVGIEGLMPFFINTDIRAYYHDGSEKLDIQLSRDSQITNKFFIRTGIRSILATKTVQQDGVGSGVNQMRFTIRPYYQLKPGLAIYTEYEHQSNYGSVSYLGSENTVTFGVMFLV
ncbi:MAG TPA: multicopper oxidase domain-containing protein [Gammaproteobacteria bacterium]|nr:multicopper oxidase domain-containing protein [Gammaproteobacteria bacterium]